MPDPSPPPLIVTLVLDAASQAWFDARRRAHFPSARLHVGAHVTMFHALPGALEPEIAAHIAELCAATAPFPVTVTGLRHLGRGVAYALTAPPAHALRAALAAAYAAHLTQQDRARWSPHVTVQNKVTPEQARETLAALAETAWPARMEAAGLGLWRYVGGPWEAVRVWAF
jgi:2'-5' RNA ligase